MIVSESGCKQLINFLIYRWHIMADLAAMERVYFASCIYAQENGHQIPDKPPFLEIQPGRQIDIIKQYIVRMLPKASFIDYAYEAPAPLDPKDFVEIFIAEQRLCIQKVTHLMEKVQIT